MRRVLLPTLDVNTTHATLTAWHKKIGDTLRAGDIVAELTTDKAAFDLESPCDGILLKILAPEKSILPAGYILALVGAPGDMDETAESDNAALLEATVPSGEAAPKNLDVENSLLNIGHSPSPPPQIRATPKARRLAQQHNIDLAKVHAQTGGVLIDEQTLLPFLA